MTTLSLTNTSQRTLFRPKDPISALSHFAGFIGFLCLMPVLLVHAGLQGADTVGLISAAVFSMSLVLLYGASTAYHSFDIEHRDVLKRLDHAMISVLIAGSYTPLCLTALRDYGGAKLLTIVWSLAILGLVVKMFWIHCPRVFSSVIYIALGWCCVLKFGAILTVLSRQDFLLLLIGGLFYTIGGVIYALKFRALEKRFPGFGAHEIFHLFVLAGSLCHFIFTFRLFLI